MILGVNSLIRKFQSAEVKLGECLAQVLRAFFPRIALSRLNDNSIPTTEPRPACSQDIQNLDISLVLKILY